MLQFRTIVIGTFVLFAGLVGGPYLAVQFDFMSGPIPLGWFRYVGVLLMLIGVPLAVWCTYLLLFHRHDENIPYASTLGLQVIGPYRYMRNPVMLGWLMVLWGEVIFIRSAALIFYAVILTLCVHFWVLGFEEPSLEDRYHEEYKRYKETVPRWLPKFKVFR